MRVSILIPTVNRLALLKESLASARAQTYGDLEILISDNGSRDGTRDYVTGVAASDPRVRLLPSNPTPDMFSNFNRLVSESTGDAFCLVSDDDRLLPDFAAAMSEPLTRDPAVAAVFCDHWIIDGRGNRLEAATAHNSRAYGRTDLLRGRVADPEGMALNQSMSIMFAMWRASLFKSEPFDSSCGGAGDIDYVIRAIRRGPLYYVPERLAEYRAHPDTTTATRTLYMLDGSIRALSKHTFTGASAEARRRDRLRDAYAVKALFISTKDRTEWRRCVGEFRALGGRITNRRVALSYVMAALPPAIGERVRSIWRRRTPPAAPSR